MREQPPWPSCEQGAQDKNNTLGEAEEPGVIVITPVPPLALFANSKIRCRIRREAPSRGARVGGLPWLGRRNRVTVSRSPCLIIYGRQ